MISKTELHKHDKTLSFTHYLIGILLLILAINAFAGGYYGMAGAKGVPMEWLKGSPFGSYFIPGLFLFICIGGSALIAAIAIFRKHRYANKAALICGVLTLSWLAIQVSIIGYVSWMQPATAVLSIIILFLTSQLSKYGH